MKLDPCPWCKEQPRVSKWTELSRSGTIDTRTGSFEPDEYNMVLISCCHAKLQAQEEDAEMSWNWK